MNQKMDAIVKTTAGPGLELRQVPVPVPGPGEVLIKIHKTAICGTDVHIYNWNQWAQETIKPPMVIGHEYVGEIAELGPGVTAYHVGQIVSGEGHIVCGHCRNCHTGNIQWCKHHIGVGVDRDGAGIDDAALTLALGLRLLCRLLCICLLYTSPSPRD